MKRSAVFLVLVAASGWLASLSVHARPPYGGTIFLDPDIITASDPTVFLDLEDAGKGMRRMFDRRENGWRRLEAFLFRARYGDGFVVEVQVNPEFGDRATARAVAAKYAEVIGRLPACLRADVRTVWIHKGTRPFGGGNSNLLIHTGQADRYAASGILEETLVHEATHTSLDAAHGRAEGWIAARTADGAFISRYARDVPAREDLAESFLPYLALRYRPDRISPDLADTIAGTIPNRIAYLDGLALDMHPVAAAEP